MKQVARQLCEILASERTDLKCAAALVLGELQDDDPVIVQRLGEFLTHGQDRIVNGYLLDALERLQSIRSIESVIPFLNQESALREKAIRVLASLGDSAIPDLAEKLNHSDAVVSRGIRVVLARIGSPKAYECLLQATVDRVTEAEGETLSALRQEVQSSRSHASSEFVDQAKKFLAMPKVKNSPPVRVAILRYLGVVDDPSAWPVLMRATRPNNHPSLRQAALTALRTVPLPRRSSEVVVGQLVAYLDDPDLSQIVIPTLEVLEPMSFAPSLHGALEDLASSRRPEVRRFALAKLGDVNTESAANVLIQFVTDRDTSLRETAVQSLVNIGDVSSVVLKKFLAESDQERSWILARILKQNADQLSSDQLHLVGEKMIRHLDNDNRLYEPLLFLLSAVSPEETRSSLVRRALRKKRSRRFQDAVRTLRLLERQDLLNPEVRYELALSLLKLSPRSPGRDVREKDPALRHFSTLVSVHFPVFERLRKETVLQPDELAYVGMHFAEKSPAEQVFGSQILRLVVRKAPRSRLAADVRSRISGNGPT